MISKIEIESLRMQALRNGDKEKKALLDYILGQVQTKCKDASCTTDPTVAIIKAYLKAAKDCAISPAVSQDGKDKYNREIEYLESLLPKAIGEEQLKQDIAVLKAAGGNKGTIMKELKARYADALDGKLAAGLI
jgi:uncharacterized protein YqeY